MAGKKLRWGLMSTARINERLIVPIGNSGRSELVAVASRSKETVDRYADEWKIPRAHQGYDGLLADPEVDAVYISLPNSMHAEWCVKSAEQGKHVLCEKPMALTAEEADRIAEAAHRNGVLIQEAAMYRYHEQTKQVREWVADGDIGEIRVIQAFFGFALAREGDIRFDPSLGGGSLWDIGSYPVSFARTMIGANPVEVEAQQVLSESGVDLTFTGQLRFASGALAQIASSFQVTAYWNAEVIGSKGRILLDHPWLNRIGQTAHLTILREGEGKGETFGDSAAGIEEQTITYEKPNAYQCELEAVEASILDGDEPVISLDDSRGNAATLAALLQSAHENRPVRL